MKEESSCAVCHQPIPQGRVHYGGVSCYSCRAFFRRNTQREELPVCKGEGECSITYIDRKQCSSCRYDKCIRTGMRPELVLTEDDKKRRFKKLLRKKEDEANIMSSQVHKHAYDESSKSNERLKEMPPLEPIKTISGGTNVFTERNPFPFLFPPSSSVFGQSMCSSNQLQDFNKYESHKTKDKNFLNKLRTEVQNYVKTSKYEQIMSKESSSSVPYNFLPTSRAFSLPSSLSVTVKPVSLLCDPSPLADHKASLPMAYSNAIKEIDAWKYLTNMQYISKNKSHSSLLNISENNNDYFVDQESSKPSNPVYGLYKQNKSSSYNFTSSTSNSSSISPPPSYSVSPPPSYSVSPPPSHSYLVCPPPSYNYSIFSPPSPNSHSIYSAPPSQSNSHTLLPTLPNLSYQHNLQSDDLRPSVITGILGQADQHNEQHIKQEPKEEYVSSAYEPIKKEQELKNDQTEEKEDLLLNYVHKKFRTHVDNIDKSSENTFIQKRKSVIFHASSSKKLCVE